jgi:hypothetical protein
MNADIRRAYDWAGQFRRDLDEPNILAGRGVYDAVWQNFQSMVYQGLEDMPDDARDRFLDMADANEEALLDVALRGQDANDNQWKTRVRDRLKQLLDAFLATDPGAPPHEAEMAGGKKKRRKTRRRRYSRRR